MRNQVSCATPRRIPSLELHDRRTTLSHIGPLDRGSKEGRGNADSIDRTLMLRLLIDQDLDHVILRGLLLRVPNLDVITAHQVGLSTASKRYACRNALGSFMVDV
jgi:hypothetical protein